MTRLEHSSPYIHLPPRISHITTMPLTHNLRAIRAPVFPLVAEQQNSSQPSAMPAGIIMLGPKVRKESFPFMSVAIFSLILTFNAGPRHQMPNLCPTRQRGLGHSWSMLWLLRHSLRLWALSWITWVVSDHEYYQISPAKHFDIDFQLCTYETCHFTWLHQTILSALKSLILTIFSNLSFTQGTSLKNAFPGHIYIKEKSTYTKKKSNPSIFQFRTQMTPIARLDADKRVSSWGGFFFIFYMFFPLGLGAFTFLPAFKKRRHKKKETILIHWAARE